MNFEIISIEKSAMNERYRSSKIRQLRIIRTAMKKKIGTILCTIVGSIFFNTFTKIRIRNKGQIL